MRLGERKTIIFHVIAVGALDLLDLMAPGRRKGDHIDPENILHPAATTVQPCSLARASSLLVSAAAVVQG